MLGGQNADVFMTVFLVANSIGFTKLANADGPRIKFQPRAISK